MFGCFNSNRKLKNLKFEKKKIELELEKQQLENQLAQQRAQQFKPSITQKFECANWEDKDHSIESAKNSAKAFKIERNYKYMRILSEHYQTQKHGDNNKAFTGKCIAAFSDNPLDLIDSKDPAYDSLKIIISELDKATLASFLVHPNQIIREATAKILDETKNTSQ